MNNDRRKGTAEEPGHERGGGWKLPLLCAAAAAAAAVLFWGLKAATTSDPAIDSELMEISTSWMQEVTENSSASFNSEIQAAVRGYTTSPARDASVAAIGRRSIDDGRLDMACAVTRYIQNRELRLSLLRDIDNTARGSCATLPWSAFAVRSIADDDPSMAATLAREVNSRWEACGRNLGPDYHEGGPKPGTARPERPESLSPDSGDIIRDDPDGESDGEPDAESGEDRDSRAAQPQGAPSELGADPGDDTPDSKADPDENDIRN